MASKLKWFPSICFILLLFLSFNFIHANKFVTVENGQFIKNGDPYYYIGTNFWYAPILGRIDHYGDRARLIKELNTLKKEGITNLRILVGAESGSKNTTYVYPTLQDSVGKMSVDALIGLDFLLNEMSKRKMYGVLYLTNAWDWSGGYGAYLSRAGFGDSPNANTNWDKYCKYASQMNTDKKAQALFWSYIKDVLNHVNKYNKRAYKDEPAIMAWQIANEPRPFSEKGKEGMLTFLTKTAKLIKSIDKNHLVSTGSEGTIGCSNDIVLSKKIACSPYIDYLTLHIWPKNWNWTSNDRLKEALPNVYLKTKNYISINERIAKEVNKPIVIEEFGYPRDNAFYGKGTPTFCRDQFYAFIFKQLLQSKHTKGKIEGCNFWGWAGYGTANGLKWKKGDEYIADPPHEPQGWYSVFASDSSTIHTINQYILQLKNS